VLLFLINKVLLLPKKKDFGLKFKSKLLNVSRTQNLICFWAACFILKKSFQIFNNTLCFLFAKFIAMVDFNFFIALKAQNNKKIDSTHAILVRRS